ncbi:MAG: amidohydrolase family protein [Gammaproteobacteria bacterium]|nr:amidohydrolase family protein [Gammaproteobacteria bacterium]MCZ6880226.1 amidohydrolase family protein [Gammaproteobacteria bacterium]
MSYQGKYLLAVFVSLVLAPGILAAEVIAITGATVYTMTERGTLNDATVLVENGHIVAVGSGVQIPDGAERVEANGRIVTPGLFDAYSYFGVSEMGLVKETVDVIQTDERYTASFELADVINPRSTLIPINRIEGVTRAMVAPRAGFFQELSNSPILGLGSVIHLGSTEHFIVARNNALFVMLGETGARLAGGSRANALLLLREALQDARDYAANRQGFEEGRRRAYRLNRMDLDSLVAVLNGQRPIVATVDRASDIESALRLANEFGIRLVINSGAEAWIVADKLADADVPVILDPLQNLPRRFESLGSTLQNAARLEKAGVTVAFSSGDSHNSRNMKQAAGVAVANGLSYETALRALTINPAEIFGLQATYGSVSVGAEADLVIWSGDPLEVSTFADFVMIRGKTIPMVSRSTLLFERYKDLDRPLPPAYTN